MCAIPFGWAAALCSSPTLSLLGAAHRVKKLAIKERVEFGYFSG
jgi:hypothetical protein